MRIGPQIFSGVWFGLLWVMPFAACDGATPAQRPEAESILGSWARSRAECIRPEFVFEATTASIQTDADGKLLRLVYEAVRYTQDESGHTTVELGKQHPYGKTTSPTALSFKGVSPNEIGLVQSERLVPFHRCAKAQP
jgi:hypothetical protein